MSEAGISAFFKSQYKMSFLNGQWCRKEVLFRGLDWEKHQLKDKGRSVRIRFPFDVYSDWLRLLRIQSEVFERDAVTSTGGNISLFLFPGGWVEDQRVVKLQSKLTESNTNGVKVPRSAQFSAWTQYIQLQNWHVYKNIG